MTILVVLLSLFAGAYALAVIERWAVHGHMSLTGPAWAALALLGRESLLARKSDRLFFELGPVLLLSKRISLRQGAPPPLPQQGVA